MHRNTQHLFIPPLIRWNASISWQTVTKKYFPRPTQLKGTSSLVSEWESKSLHLPRSISPWFDIKDTKGRTRLGFTRWLLRADLFCIIGIVMQISLKKVTAIEAIRSKQLSAWLLQLKYWAMDCADLRLKSLFYLI